jgi:phosphatidylserine/phosphatidylglycerophosphate/cardiolipin synthase-like enzyme
MSRVQGAGSSLALIALVFIVGASVGFFLALGLHSQRGLEVPGLTVTRTVEERLTEPTSIYLLENREYYSKLLETVRKANQSVYVVMYVVKYDPKEPDDPVNMLLQVLVDLYKAGKDVKILVDDETYKSYPETVQYLVSKGVPVRLDPKAGTTTHAKIVVVDSTYVFVGSHNWTESALTANNEVSALIISKEIAREALAYFSGLWEQGRSV